MCCYYILYSKKLNRFYTVVTQDDLEERIKKHNINAYGSHRYTAKANDWELYLAIECQNYDMARRIELHIKKMKSSNYIENLKEYPDLVEKLKLKYKG